MFFSDYKCSACGFTRPAPDSGFDGVWLIYALEQDCKAKYFFEEAWCGECRAVTFRERIPSLSEVEAYLRKLRSEHAERRNTESHFMTSCRALEEEFLRSGEVWKKWARANQGRRGRCFTCGAIADDLEDVSRKAHAWGDEKTYRHPGCGGELVNVPGMHLSMASPPELQLILFDADGCRVGGRRPQDARDSQRGKDGSGERQRPGTEARRRLSSEAALHRNPFWVLGASTRDNRKRIIELVDEKSLEIDHAICQKAHADLTNPRLRLAAEVGWLPGVSPRRASQLAQRVLEDPLSLRGETGLPDLAKANLLEAAFESVSDEDEPEEVANFILEIAHLADDVEPEEVLRDINEDRAISGFPEVKSEEQVEAELKERRRQIRSTVRETLNRLKTASLLEAVSIAVRRATAEGERAAPTLIDDIVDSYEVEAQSFLASEAANIGKLVEAARSAAPSGERGVMPIVDQLEAVTRNWDKVAQPIQLSMRARGIEHEHSKQLAYSIRSLAIDLFNEHDLLAQSNRLTNLVREHFAELPDVAERVEADAEALRDIARDRKEAEERRAEWAREITYSAEIGMVLKDTLSISPSGVSWKGQTFSLQSITKVRWGGVRHSINGLPTGTTYTIGFGDGRSEAIVESRRAEVFSAFTEKLWRAVGVRIITEMLQALKDGRRLNFGDAQIADDGVTLTKRRFLGTNDRVFFDWSQVHVWSADGCFYIGATQDKKIYAALSYIETPNVHLLEQLIRVAFKKGVDRLSEALQDN